MGRKLAVWLFIVAVLCGSFLRCQDLLEPYEDGHRGSCAAFFAIMARNHLRHGLATTGGVAVLNPDWAGKEHFAYYLHHPPGAILLATIGAGLGGTNPSGLRLAFVPFAIGVIFLVHRLARRRGLATAAAAGAIAALTPIGVYYGPFVNFEVPTLFFVLLTLHFFLRYQHDGERKDLWRSLLAQAAAVFCDWIALGLPFCLAACAAFRRRRAPAGGGRAGPLIHALALLAAAVLVVLAVQAQVMIQLSRFSAQAPDASLAYYRAVTPLAPDFDWADFGRNMAEYGATLFGWPLLALAFAGLALALPRLARRRLDDASLAGLVMLAFGLGNVVILGNHARGHDYYQLYLLPAFAILAASVFRFRVTARPARGAAYGLQTCALIVLLGWQVFHSVQVLSERRSFKLSEFGEMIKEHTEMGSLVVLPHYFTLQVSATAERYVVWARDRAQLDAELKRARAFGKVGKRVLFLNTAEEGAAVSTDLAEHLREHGARSERGPFVIYDLGNLEPQ
ncbi:MAG: glycosyltransferase family 39 protein [Planctomycetes bacterium]|nr:glycosyltransferase family 39 protein [Planctomycetota bacterium]